MAVEFRSSIDFEVMPINMVSIFRGMRIAVRVRFMFVLSIFVIAGISATSFSETALAEKSAEISEEEGKAAAKEAIVLDSIVVTAKKEAQLLRTGDVDLQSTPASVSLIQREVFEGRTENLADVIEKEAGVQVRRSGGLGSFSTVSLRGASGDQVMIFLDGILLNDASGGGVDLSNIALSDVEAIEIYRGVTPVNFGRASIGGVVNIRTLRAAESSRAASGEESADKSRRAVSTVTAGYGSFNTRKAGALVNHKPGKLDYLISADHLSSDNDFKFLNDNGTDWNSSDDSEEKRENAAVKQSNVLGKAGYDLTDTLRVDLMNQYFEKEQGLPSWNNSSLNLAELDTVRNITTLGVTADDLTQLHLNNRAQLSYTWKEEEYEDSRGYIGLGNQHNTYTTRRLEGDLFTELPTDHHTLLISTNVAEEIYESEDHLSDLNPEESSRNSGSLGIQDSVYLMDESLIITPAVRYTLFQDQFRGVETGTAAQTDDRDDGYFNSQVGLRYSPVESLTLRSNLAQYVRHPSFFELYGDRGFVIGNSDLKEEKGVNCDFGAEFGFHNLSSRVERVTFGVTGFRSDVDDLITRVYDSRGIGKSVNISGALIQGVELGASMEFCDHFRVLFNATKQEPENQSQIELFNGKQLPGRFELSCLARLEARYRGYMAYGEYVHDEGMFYDTANLLEAEDKREVNIGLSWIFREVKISLEGKNMTDELYEDFNGYPLPGRSFYLSLKYNL